MANGMDPIYNLWNMVVRLGKKETETIWMKVPRIFRCKDDEQGEIVRKQLALILDGPDRKQRNYRHH